MAEWQPINTAPRDGMVFMGATTDGICSPCCIIAEPDETVTKRRLFGLLPTKTKTKKGGTFIYYAMPHGRGWMRMGMRPDFGWSPTHWMPLPEPPAEV